MNIRLLSSALILTLILTFSACGEEKAEYRITTFTGYVTVECGGDAYEGSLNFSSCDKAGSTLSLPERSEGLTFSLDGGRKTLIQGDVQVSAEGFGGIFTFLEVLCAFAGDSYTLPVTGRHNISFLFDGKEYTVTFSCDEGRVVGVQGSDFCAEIA